MSVKSERLCRSPSTKQLSQDPSVVNFIKKRFSITKTECMTSKLQNSNHITNTCDTVWLMIAFACENVQNWHHDKFMGPLLNFRTCKLKNELTVFSLAYIQPKNTVYRTSHPIYCLLKLILDRWGPYDENFDLVCSSFLTLFTKQRLPFWFSCKHESVADHMTWLIYHQPMKISHTKLFCSVFVRIELIGTQHYYNLKMSLRFDRHSCSAVKFAVVLQKWKTSFINE